MILIPLISVRQGDTSVPDPSAAKAVPTRFTGKVVGMIAIDWSFELSFTCQKR